MSEDRARSPHVAVIGSGMSGIYMAVMLQKAGYEFTILEKASDIGGTWRDNTYPGLVIDAPARWYSYPFEPNPEWTQLLAPGPEIFRYFDGVVAKYGLREHTRFNSEVVSAQFEDNRWHLHTQDGHEVVADFVVTACGFLHHPRYPDIDGLDSFAGPAFHSARFDHSVELAGKRVGVIGTGSTGVQLVGALSKMVGHVTHFQRTPQWILPLPNKKFSRLNKMIVRRFPGLLRVANVLWRKSMGGIFSRALAEDGFSRTLLSTACRLHLRTVRDPELRRRLTPNYKPLCKRVVMGIGFYGAVQRDNVEVISGDVIDHIEPAGIVTKDGTLHELDVLVLATGFDGQAYIRPMKVTGQHGVTLDELWGDVPKAYNTVALPNLPNFFMMSGPHNPLANQPIIDGATVQVGYIMQMLELYRDGVYDLASPTTEATAQFQEELRSALSGANVFNSGCSSWYQGADGLPSLWPWRTTAYADLLRTPVIDDFELQNLATDRPRELGMNGPPKAVLFDYAGTMTEDMLPVFAAHAAAVGATLEDLASMVLGGYGAGSDHPLHRVERGELSLAEFAAWGRDQGAERGWTVDLQALQMSIMDLPIRPEMVAYVRGLRASGVRTALVTNAARETSALWRAKALVDDLFDVVIDSSEVGLRKPDPAIFAVALERLGVDASDAVLLDDIQVNLDAAEAMGMHAILVETDPTEALRELDRLVGQGQEIGR